MTDLFYADLKPFSDFSQLSERRHFVKVPENWSVVLTDVRGSTKAIQEGRYKDVNLIGAASVTCVLNALGTKAIPFVFGGDGATLLVPDTDLEQVKNELLGLKAISQKDFGLELRVGFVPVQRLRELGAEISVGKYELSPGNTTAQFRGNGLTLAEKMVKTGMPAGAALLELKGDEAAPKLTGLSCRLEPLESRHGRILSILVKPLGNADEAVLADLLAQLKEILRGDFHSASPVRQEALKWRSLPQSLAAEVKLQKRGKPALVQWPLTVSRVMISRLLLKYQIPLGGFEPKMYRAELVRNSDFKKFDETLRMVIDCTPEQEAAIDACLERAKREGKISYGIHRSSNALMTCMVFSATQNQHIHFVDGGGGGYALAAAQMKAQS